MTEIEGKGAEAKEETVRRETGIGTVAEAESEIGEEIETETMIMIVIGNMDANKQGIVIETGADIVIKDYYLGVGLDLQVLLVLL